MEVFRELGLAEEVRAAALPGGPRRLLGSDVVSPWRSVVTSNAYTNDSADTSLGPETLDVVLCSQDVLEPILVDAAQAQESVAVEFGKTVSTVNDTGGKKSWCPYSVTQACRR